MHHLNMEVFRLGQCVVLMWPPVNATVNALSFVHWRSYKATQQTGQENMSLLRENTNLSSYADSNVGAPPRWTCVVQPMFPIVNREAKPEEIRCP
jgi:hypothetical protein